MKKLWNGTHFSVKKVNDKDIDDVIVKLYKSDSMIGGKPVFIGYKMADMFDCHEDVAEEIYDSIRKGTYNE